MTATLLMDGVKYKLWTPQKENELEEKVKEHIKDIFGEDSIYFEKRKISSKFGILSIPDGFVIDLRSKKLYAIEIELATHRFDHVVSQGYRHIHAMKDLGTKHKLVKGFNDEIKSDPYKRLLAKNFIGDDLYHFLTSISENPELVMVVDGISKDIKQAGEDLSARIIEFKTFEREGIGLGVHVHLFEPVVEREVKPKPKLEGKPTPEREYRIPILEALIETGGKGMVRDILEKVGAKMKDKLTKIDYEKLPSGAYVRWKNYAMWERLNMIHDGLLKKGSPRGIWEITDKGQEYFIKRLESLVSEQVKKELLLVLEKLDKGEGVSVAELATTLNISQAKIYDALRVLIINGEIFEPKAGKFKRLR